MIYLKWSADNKHCDFLSFTLAGMDSNLIISVLLPHRRCFVNLNEAARSRADVRPTVSERRVRLSRMCCHWQTYSHFPSPLFLPQGSQLLSTDTPADRLQFLSPSYHLQCPGACQFPTVFHTAEVERTLSEVLDSTSAGSVSQNISQPHSTSSCFQC